MSEICQRCGRPATHALGTDTYWFADSDLWNEVIGSPTGIRCAQCFTTEAQAMDIHVGWRAGRVGEIEGA